MDPRPHLLGSDHRHVLEFFMLGLLDVCEQEVEQQELLYNASILAHFAQVSTATDVELPTPRGLTDVFDHFVYDDSLREDAEMMESAAAQCLLLAGFFEDQMRRRHNVGWYARLGSTFFARAAKRAHSTRRAQLLHALGRRFEPWRQRYARLSRELRDRPYLVTPPPAIM